MIPKFNTTLLLVYVASRKKSRWEEATDVVSFAKVTHLSYRNHEGFLWEALVCEKLIPKPAPNGTIFLPRHVGAIPWHHAKSHEFQTSFGFTWIWKPSSQVCGRAPNSLGVWNPIPFVAWDLSMHPRTYIWFFNPFWCIRARACSWNLNYAHKMTRKFS